MRAALAGLLLFAALGACSGGGGAPSNCGAPHHEPLDPRSVIHLLPGAPELPYNTDPPTSGAHRVGFYPRGVDPSAITRPVQVALLERGFVLVQYQPTLGASAVASLGAVTAVSPYVTIAPNPTLPNPVVATAWVYDVRCTDAGPSTVRALEAFVHQRVGRGPNPEIPLSDTAPGGVPPRVTP